ncbi:hypothetical protein ACP70R_044197 [Stipagrostis hirtigluma subsp. patula]
MATAQVQQAIPAVVHEGSCFAEEENNHEHEIVAQDDAPTAEAVEEAHAQALHNDGVDHAAAKQEAPPEDAIATSDGGDGLLVDAVAQEVEAKLGVQDVVDGASAAAAEATKLPKEEGAPRRREVVTRKAKAVVVPVDDDDEEELDREAARAEPAEEAPVVAADAVDVAAGEGADGEVQQERACEKAAHEE